MHYSAMRSADRFPRLRSGVVKTVAIVVISAFVGFLLADRISSLLNLKKAEINNLSIVYEPIAKRGFVSNIENFFSEQAQAHGIKVGQVNVLEASNICDEIAIQAHNDVVVQISISGERCALSSNVIQMFPLNAYAGFKALFNEMPTLIEAAESEEADNALIHILTTLPYLKASVLPRLSLNTMVSWFQSGSYLLPCIFLLLIAVVLFEICVHHGKTTEVTSLQSLHDLRRCLTAQDEQKEPIPDAPPSYDAHTRPPKKFDSQMPVSAESFSKHMNEAVEFAIDYLENNDRYPVTTDQKPGFLMKSLPKEGPTHPEEFKSIMNDVRTKIIPGLTHWQHKRFHAFFPLGCSFPDVIADVILSSLGVVGFTYDACPALAEMEMAMVNWLGRAFGLSERFLYQGTGKDSVGGGSIQPSASDCIYLTILASRFNKIKDEVSDKVNDDTPQDQRVELETNVLKRLVAYGSPEAHSSFEKGCNMAMVRLHKVDSDENFALRGDALECQIKKDLKKGLIPFHVHCTMGTTGICSFDNLTEVGKVAKKYGLWFHVDGAYAGSALICPEFRVHAEGLELANSFNVNTHKFLLQAAVQSFIWTTDQAAVKAAFKIKASYYQNQSFDSVDPRDWGISLSRRFQGLRLWFLFRMYGIAGLQAYIRRIVGHAATFERLIRTDSRLKIVGKRELGLVCFKVKHFDEQTEGKLTKGLVDHINRSHKLMVTHSEVKGIHVCRINVSHERSTESDILESWEILEGLINEYLAQNSGSQNVLTRIRRSGANKSGLRLCNYD